MPGNVQNSGTQKFDNFKTNEINTAFKNELDP